MFNHVLFIGGVEWIIIIFIALIFILGPKRLPEVGRTLGKVMGEYERTRRNIRREIDRMSVTNIPITGAVASEREKLEAIARVLNIDPAGKSDDELRRLISERLNR